MSESIPPTWVPDSTLHRDFLSLTPHERRAMLRADQHVRWQRRDLVPVEFYLKQYPALEEDEETLLDLIQTEILLREVHGEHPCVDEYIQRFPQLASNLHRHFELHHSFRAGLPLAEKPLSENAERDNAPAITTDTAPPLLMDMGDSAVPLTHIPGTVPGTDPQGLVDACQVQQTEPKKPSPVQWIAGYEVLGELGRGGMGVVYKARQPGLNRLVALKMILHVEHASDQERERFHREAQAIAHLRHPNIVQIYEVGEHDDKPFFSLELIEGGNLEERLRGTPQPPGEAALLVETLARTIHVAHQQGIIHRDLKPANVLLALPPEPWAAPISEFQVRENQLPPLGAYHPRITDFGLAKKLDEAIQTQSGAIMGTPSYMAPEQAAGKTREIGPATDVYALGALLYECLTGRPPFKAATAMDTMLQVLHEEPVPPGRLQPGTPRDLETICLKCLHKEPDSRYESAIDLAEDLHRFLVGEPVLARRNSAWERGIKWVKRRPAVAALLGVSCVTVLALVVAGVGLFYQTQLENTNVQLEQQKTEADKQRENAEDAKGEVERQRDQLLRAKKDIETERNLGRRYLYAAHMNLAHRALQEANLGRMNDLLAEQRPEAGEEDLCGFEWYHLWRLGHRERQVLQGHKDPVTSVSFHPGGKQVASGSKDKSVKIWDATTGRLQFTLMGHAHPVTCVVYSPQGDHLATASKDGTIKVWDTAGKELFTLKTNQDNLKCVGFAPRGNVLASAGTDRTVKLWDLDRKKEMDSFVAPPDVSGILVLNPENLHCALAFSPDEKFLAVACVSGQVLIWDRRKKQPVRTLKGHREVITSLAFSPDGQRLATASVDHHVRLWDLQEGTTLLTFRSHRQPVLGVVFSPDGKHLASAGKDDVLFVWQRETGKEILTFRLSTGAINALSYSSDGRRLVTGHDDKSVRIWDAGPQQEDIIGTGHGETVSSVAFHPDGEQLASASHDRTIKLWHTSSGTPTATLEGHASKVTTVAFSPDRKHLASASYDLTVKLWDLTTGREVRTLEGHQQWVEVVAFSPDGKYLASGGWDEVIKVWEVSTGKELYTCRGHRGIVRCVAFSPNGQQLASGGDDKSIKLWDARTGKETQTLQGHTDTVTSVAFAPGELLASASWDRTVLLWDATTGNRLRTLKGHDQWVVGIAFSPDGKRLASASWDHTIKLWDSATGQELLTLRGHTANVTGVAFNADGTRLASCSEDKTVRVWTAPRP